MSRYFSSFFIAFTIYAITIFFLFFFVNNTKVINPSLAPIVQKISLNQVELKNESNDNNVKEIIEQKNIQNIKKQEEKVVEKKEIAPKKVVKEEKKSSKEEIKPTVENKIISEIQEDKEKIVETKIDKNNIQNVNSDSKEYVDKNLALIRNLINENVKYPPKARKLSIQGIVVVKFKILENGTVENIEIVEGHTLLQSSTIEAIEEASKKFPKSNSTIEIQIPIEYKLL